MFFRNLTSVGMEMKDKLHQKLQDECYCQVQSLQLSQADLPQKFEDALTATNVAIQDSITVKQTQQNVVIDMETQVRQARISAPIVINNAEAKVNSTLEQNKAQMESYLQVTMAETEAYASMKTELGFKTDK
jgi:hypothetical protein